MDEREHVGVLGATSLVGQNLLARLSKTGCAVTAYSRKEMTGNTPEIRGVSWRRLPTAPRPENGDVSP
ncbi:MAG: hypothetical protein LBJ76_02405, partial [Candidatus Accumulibacter sp.]|nr:hypothetical protein [Accumulibacter sp.]